MIYLDKIYEDFTSSDKIFSLLESHGIVVSKYSSIAPNLRTVLEKSINEEAITRDEALMLSKVNSSEIPFLMAAANFIRTKHKGNLITFSKNIFIPLTQLCRDQCSYCTFKIEPHEGDLLIEPEDVLESAKKAVKLGCTELLFVSGDRPENIYDVYQKKLESMGYRSTADYMIAMSEICLEEGIFPHSNLGIARIDELKRFKNSNPSMGLMLENISERLMDPGEAHYRCPDKYPRARVKTISNAGELNIPWTSGILIGIGENWEERIDSIYELQRINNEYGHIQEIIIQNFNPKPGIQMEGHPPPTDFDMIKTVAISKIIMGPSMNIQVPPNLNSKTYMLHICSGVNDLGGVSPITIDYVNPECPWPQIDLMTKDISEFGFNLRERLPVYPDFLNRKFLNEDIYNKAISFVDDSGYVAEN
jgi:7,8-didemethyl-8-hydroxy-5-deazariboflavin synthase CofG subunit|tara:strand:+ start:1792 stop:3051 length:1260 start_codon:yes stop_codon:yes gene_type:complete